MITIGLDFIRAYTPAEQLVMLHLLLHADENGNVEFSDRGVSRTTDIPYQRVRTIHKKMLAEGVLANAVANAVANAKSCFVTICDYESYNTFNIISNAVTNAVINAVKEKEITKDKDKVFPLNPLPTEKENNKEKELTPIPPQGAGDSNLFPTEQRKVETEKAKKKEPTTELEKQFDAFRRKYKKYGGMARGFETEFENFKKKHKDWKEVIPMLDYALEMENDAREEAESRHEFFAQMKNLQTYINQRSWENYTEGYEDFDPNAYHPALLKYDEYYDAYRMFGDPNYDLEDGYTDENRPDGARVVQQRFVYVWSSLAKTWIEQ